MVLKMTGYIKDPFKSIDVFKLTCYHFCKLEDYSREICYKDTLTFDNTEEIYEVMEDLVMLNKQWKEWKKWLNEPAHEVELYKEEWDGEEKNIIPTFKRLYHLIENYAVEQFALLDHMDLRDSGFKITYVDKFGKEYDVDTTELGWPRLPEEPHKMVGTVRDISTNEYEDEAWELMNYQW